MAVDDVLDDGEAEAGAAQLARARGIDAIEALGEPRQMVGRNAVALVATATATRRAPASRRAATRTVVAGLAYFSALSTRFWNTMVSSS